MTRSNLSTSSPSHMNARHHTRRPRRAGLWPAFRERVVLGDRPFQVSAWRVGRDAAILLRPEPELDADQEVTVPLSEWAGFVWNAVHKYWERVAS